MSFKILIPGPNGTVATMTKAQIDLAQPILLALANRRVLRGVAQVQIEQLLADAGDPLVFEERS